MNFVLLQDSAGCTQKRTTFVLNIIIGMPICKKGFQPFVLHPILYPADVIQKMTAEAGAVTRISTVQHPIHLALEWRQRLISGKNMTLAKIAREKGFSRARVTQIMRLLCLDERIQKHLLKITAAADIAFFSERQLRMIAVLKSMEQQISAFKALAAERDQVLLSGQT